MAAAPRSRRFLWWLSLLQTGVDPFRATPESVLNGGINIVEARGRCVVRTRTPEPWYCSAIANEPMLSAHPRGRSERHVHHVLFLHCHGTTCPSRRAFASAGRCTPACTCVPMVTTPRQGPELVKPSVTVRSGQWPPASWGLPRPRPEPRSRAGCGVTPPGFTHTRYPAYPGRRGRAAECTCLENRRPSRVRGFKSLRLRSLTRQNAGGVDLVSASLPCRGLITVSFGSS